MKWIGLLVVAVIVAPVWAQSQEPTADTLQTLPGFNVEVVLKADKNKHGSFISLAKDDKGRLLLGGQRGQPVTRLTLENGKISKEETLKLPVSEVMGMLWHDGALYADGFGKDSAGKGVFGLFRLRDPAGDGTFSSVEMLREWKGGAGEHGAHAILLGPDKKHLYIVCGNFVDQPADLSPNSPHRNFADDRVLPRAEDGNGFGAGKKPPGGSVFRMDLDGKNVELFASGDRNTYDVAFNADGELLGFDSDMEWDWGTPWYRPIRVYHAASGADQGFREGTAKWPEYYEDSLPPAVPIGIGCPTGVAFGYGAKFPAKYQKAFYILDWTYGRLIAVHLVPNGASYSGSWENFIAPKSLHEKSGKIPLNLTDIVIGDDGAMYFTIGGRNTQAYLYRVTYTGNESTASIDPHDSDGAAARELRHKLEAFQGHADPSAVETAWAHLNSDDRFIRYAARLAIESQPVEQWKSRALSEMQPQAAIEALLALARLGGNDAQADVLNALAKIPLASLTKPLQLQKLRVLEVSIARQGKPVDKAARSIIAELNPLYPNEDVQMNRELAQVLLALGAPDAVARTVALMNEAITQEEQVSYALALRTVTAGWTPELRKEYFSWFTEKRDHVAHPSYVTQWFADAGIDYSNGASYNNFIAHIHDDAAKALTPDEQKELGPVVAAFVPPGRGNRNGGRRQIPVHSFVKEWKMPDIEPELEKVSSGRNFVRGRDAYEVAQCASCHKLGDAGGAVGPDLTAISSRFKRRDILESILEPSKVVSEQYMNTAFRLKSGDVILGRVMEETDQKVVVRTDPLKDTKTEIQKADVEARKLSPISPMPEGLVNNLSKDEILDLIAYLESGGKRDHPDFSR
jgi:putative heme-binding domain-containing protein